MPQASAVVRGLPSQLAQRALGAFGFALPLDDALLNACGPDSLDIGFRFLNGRSLRNARGVSRRRWRFNRPSLYHLFVRSRGRHVAADTLERNRIMTGNVDQARQRERSSVLDKAAKGCFRILDRRHDAAEAFENFQRFAVVNTLDLRGPITSAMSAVTARPIAAHAPDHLFDPANRNAGQRSYRPRSAEHTMLHIYDRFMQHGSALPAAFGVAAARGAEAFASRSTQAFAKITVTRIRNGARSRCTHDRALRRIVKRPSEKVWNIEIVCHVVLHQTTRSYQMGSAVFRSLQVSDTPALNKLRVFTDLTLGSTGICCSRANKHNNGSAYVMRVKISKNNFSGVNGGKTLAEQSHA